MRISDAHWRQVEEYLSQDDRCILPLGSTEQHGPLSLAVDAILAEKVAVDAAEPLGVPVFPPMNYGLCPYFMAYPGSVSLCTETLLAVVHDILASLRETGFRRVLIVNGHGGNAPAAGVALDAMRDAPGFAVKFHDWWRAPRTWAKVQEIDPVASHASWMENFPWTRIRDVAMPNAKKPMVDGDRLRVMGPAAARAYLGDGVFGGAYQKPNAEMMALWDVAVEETCAGLEGPWS
ncbi:MAG: creatininase family protein [Pseudomonadota bacterium]